MKKVILLVGLSTRPQRAVVKARPDLAFACYLHTPPPAAFAAGADLAVFCVATPGIDPGGLKAARTFAWAEAYPTVPSVLKVLREKFPREGHQHHPRPRRQAPHDPP